MIKKILLLGLIATTFYGASAQKIYFVYLQSEAEHPFFVKMNDKIYSSSPSGYLILSKLRDTSYSFSVGFPQSKWAEQNFTFNINKKDQGFILKNLNEKGWGLYNLQTSAMNIAVNNSNTAASASKTEVKDVSKFTDILSKAADDPSLKEKPVEKTIEAEKPVVQPIQEVAKKEEAKPKLIDTVLVNNVEIKEKPVEPKPVEVKKEVVIEKPVEAKEISAEPKPPVEKKEEAVEKPVLIKEKPVEVKSQEQMNKVKPVEETLKIDEAKPVEKKEDVMPKPVESKQEEQKRDTQPLKEVENKPDQQTGYKRSIVTKKYETSTSAGFGLVFIDEYQNGIKDTIDVMIPEPKQALSTEGVSPKEEKKFLDINTNTPAQDAVKIGESKALEDVKTEVKPQAMEKCSNKADDNDFLNLRKNMAIAKNDEEMLVEAKKDFKKKCFSTEQIKNLGVLFLRDEGRYRFYDLAYSFVFDSTNFPSLQNELRDEYYINRFKAMLRN